MQRYNTRVSKENLIKEKFTRRKNLVELVMFVKIKVKI